MHTFHKWLLQNGMQLTEVASILRDFPSIDKLVAFTFTRYRRIVFIDVDLLILRDMSRLFDTPASRSSAERLTMAHHPYDLVQGMRCGIPLEQRGVGAILGLSPNKSAYPALVASILGDCAADHDMCRHYSEQLFLSCTFYTRGLLETLPCSFLYDVSLPRYQSRRAHGVRNCMLNVHRLSNGSMGRRECNAIANHVGNDCLWQHAYRDVHAVHFKGKIKPWAFLKRPSCHPVGITHGHRLMLLDSPSVLEQTRSTDVYSRAHRPLNGADNRRHNGSMQACTGPDNLIWSEEIGACFSRRHGLRVQWTDGSPLAKECCKIDTALAVEWRALRAEFCLEMHGKQAVPSAISRDCLSAIRHRWMLHAARRAQQKMRNVSSL